MPMESIFSKHIRSAWVVLPQNHIIKASVLFDEDHVVMDGELVFNTSFNGYTEIITDPSYAQQFVLFTHPHVGSYGVDPRVFQSPKPQCSGIFVHRCDSTVDFHTLTETQSLARWMLAHKKPIVFGLHQRELTQHIRSQGALRCRLLIGESFSKQDALNQNLPDTPMAYSDSLLSEVSTRKSYTYGDPNSAKFNVAVFDFGVKRGILECLESRQCTGTVYPWNTPWQTIKDNNHDGLVLSNGPGDPSRYRHVIEEIKTAIGNIPILAICLGHQLLCLALGGESYKLKFGHRGGNHPVRDFEKNVTAIAAHNHGFAIKDDFFKKQSEWKIWFRNLNDGSLSGIKSPHALSVQFHPEGSPGPHDARYVFDQFIQRLQA